MKITSHSSRRNDAFTLVELLTVIAIIGILAAIIIPVVGKVRQSANKSTCASNLRQVGVALNSYLADHREALPGYDKIKDKDGEFFALVRDVGPRWQLDNGNPTRALISHLAPYMDIQMKIPATGSVTGVSKFAVCPAIPTAGNAEPASSYYLSKQVRLNDGTLKRPFALGGKPSIKRFDMANPGKAVAMFDIDAPILALISETAVTTAPDAAVHGATRNVLYFDGHVASVNKDINPHETL